MKMGLFILVIALSLFINSCEDSDPNQQPVVVISANPVSGLMPLTVRFTASAEDSDGIITSYDWDFGDGSGSASLQNATYIYNSTGTFTVTCTVRDNGKPALTATAILTVSVYQSKIPTLSSISPEWSVIHAPKFTLTLTGTDFLPDSIVFFNNSEIIPAYVSPTQLTCEISQDYTELWAFYSGCGPLNLGSDQYAGVYVHNPGVGGGDSATLNFTVRPNHIFDSPTLVGSKTSRDSYRYMEIIKGGPLYVIYDDWTSGPNPDEARQIRVSKNNGQSWSDARSLPSGASYYCCDLDAGRDGILYLAQLGISEIYFRKSLNDGISWTDPVLIYAGTPDDYQFEYNGQSSNILRLDDGTLYSAYMESRIEVWSTDGEFYGSWVFHSTSDDGGSTWSTVKKIPETTANVYLPFLDRSLSGKIHYFYETGIGDPLYASSYGYITSSDKGSSWSQPVELLPFAMMGMPPTIGDDDGLYLPVIKEGPTSRDISVRYWLQGEAAWETTSPAVSLGLGQQVENMSVSVDSAGNINLFYTRGPSENTYAVYYQRSFDQGKNWTAPLRLSPLGCRIVKHPQVCGPVGNLFVIWTSVNSPYPIYFTSSKRNSE